MIHFTAVTQSIHWLLMHKPKSVHIVTLWKASPSSRKQLMQKVCQRFPVSKQMSCFQQQQYITQKKKTSAGDQSTRGPLRVHFKCWSRLLGGRGSSRVHSHQAGCSVPCRNTKCALVKQTGRWESNMFGHDTDRLVWARPKRRGRVGFQALSGRVSLLCSVVC